MGWEGEQSMMLPTACCLLSSKVYGVLLYSDKSLGSVQVVAGWHIVMMYRKSIPIIWNHLLTVRDVNLQLPLEIWPAVTLSTEPVPLLCAGQKAHRHKRLAGGSLIFFLLLKLLTIFFSWQLLAGLHMGEENSSLICIFFCYSELHELLILLFLHWVCLDHS